MSAAGNIQSVLTRRSDHPAPPWQGGVKMGGLLGKEGKKVEKFSPLL